MAVGSLSCTKQIIKVIEQSLTIIIPFWKQPSTYSLSLYVFLSHGWFGFWDGMEWGGCLWSLNLISTYIAKHTRNQLFISQNWKIVFWEIFYYNQPHLKNAVLPLGCWIWIILWAAQFSRDVCQYGGAEKKVSFFINFIQQ